MSCENDVVVHILEWSFDICQAFRVLKEVQNPWTCDQPMQRFQYVSEASMNRLVCLVARPDVSRVQLEAQL